LGYQDTLYEHLTISWHNNLFLYCLPGNDPSRWVKVNEKRTLHDVLKEPNLVIPGIPGIAFLVLVCLLNFK